MFNGSEFSRLEQSAKTAKNVQTKIYVETCPFCGRTTLRRDNGIVKCIACSWRSCK